MCVCACFHTCTSEPSLPSVRTTDGAISTGGSGQFIEATACLKRTIVKLEFALKY